MDTQTNNKVIFGKMLRWQLLATMFVTTLAGLLVGVHGALSGLVGGLIALVGAFIGAKVATSNKNNAASTVLVSMLKGEGVKILVIATLLFAAFKLYTALVPMALIVGLGASAIFSGAAIANLSDQS